MNFSQEAQGFTPTDSHSRLYYDFNKEQKPQQKNYQDPMKGVVTQHEKPQAPTSPSKVRGMSLAELVRSNSPVKLKSSAAEKQELDSTCLPASQPPNNSLPSPPPPPPPPPVVVSCLPKTPIQSPTRPVHNATSLENRLVKVWENRLTEMTAKSVSVKL